MTTWSDYVKFYFPKADKATVDFILFGMTSFPLGRRAVVKKQIQAARRKIRAAQKLHTNCCEGCGNPTPSADKFLCVKCDEDLRMAA